MAKTDLADAPAGTELFDVQEKIFPDVQAQDGESAYTFMRKPCRTRARWGSSTC